MDVEFTTDVFTFFSNNFTSVQHSIILFPYSLAELVPRSQSETVRVSNNGKKERFTSWSLQGLGPVSCRWLQQDSQGSLQFKTASKDKQNHTLLLISGSFSLDNLPDPIIVEEQVMEKENNLDISSMFKKIQPPAAAASPETVTKLRKEMGRCFKTESSSLT